MSTLLQAPFPTHPTTPPPRGIFRASVHSNTPLCREHFLLRLSLPAHFPPTRPGQFLQVLCRNPDETYEPLEQTWTEGTFPHLACPDTAARTAVLRRPFSIASRYDQPDGTTHLDLIHRTVGPGTDFLSHLRPGDPLSILGPLGNTFPIPHPDQPVLLIGGGVGIPPMIYLAQSLARPKVIAFCGAQTQDLLSLTRTTDAPPPSSPTSIAPLYNFAEFSRYGVPAVITTDDGSYGFKGFITQALEAYLDKFFPNSWDISTPHLRPLLFTCGPEIMMKRVAEIALKRGLTCHAAVERAMACGMGTCQSCTIRVKAAPPTATTTSPTTTTTASSPTAPAASSPTTPATTPSTSAPLPPWRYALSCTEGPIFNTTDLLW